MPTTWRSPQRVPRPPRVEDHPAPADPVQKLAFGGAWRHRAFAGALAHGLRRAPLGSQRDVLDAIARALDASDAFLEAAGALDVTDAPRRLEARLAEEPLPNAESWAELTVADVVMAGALQAAAAALSDSADPSLREAAARAAAPTFGPAALDELAADAPNRACLQLLVERWLPAALACFGRPGSEAEGGLLADRTKAQPSGEAAAAYLRGLAKGLGRRGLGLPVANRLGMIVTDYPDVRRTAG